MTQNSRRIVIFGETLFDRFNRADLTLGGAPLNVAWNLKGFGFDPILLSAVGDDRLGRQALEKIESFGLDASAIQIDRDHRTGLVEITQTGADHTFDILPDRAFDHIDPALALDALGSDPIDLFYHGSLCARSKVSEAALYAIRNSFRARSLVDVNLRAPWFEQGSVMRLLTGANIVKLNLEEARLITASPDATEIDQIERIARAALDERGWEGLIVTMAERGAMILQSDRLISSAPPSVEDFKSAVGAGDAFTSVLIVGLLEGWPTEALLSRALKFGSKVCSIQGAITEEKDFYRATKNQWVDSTA